MHKYRLALTVMIGMSLLIASCSKENEPAIQLPAPTDIVGKWNLTQVYGNDYWGGPLSWRTTSADTKIEFTADKKYYWKYSFDTAYTYIGTYTRLSDSTLQITPIKPINPDVTAYVLTYFFEKGGLINLGDFATEGVIRERFQLSQ